ncbi:MAG TPA: CSLREA domain-containing protein, partial [Ardenticatenaceae bacterium]|nr:CSLREA domain-containing protein [Ardenticatenaceae bacterium]
MQPLLPARPRAAAPPILYALLLALGLVALPLVLRAQGRTITVNSLADPGDGRCNPAECTLREAITSAAAGDSIDFSVTGSITLT